ncbi:heterokaryon incompatibility protein-domain-containing protein [Annulohypoxylon nitens]|nr:heterokaryon incompatibility protein-domain-containing protein [Annulohypoxylon nitens]
MTCEKCATISTILIGDKMRRTGHSPDASEVTHYHTFAELKASAEKGCSPCKLFQKVLLETTLRGYASPEDKQRDLDSRRQDIMIRKAYVQFQSRNAPFEFGIYGIHCYRGFDFNYAPVILISLVSGELPNKSCLIGRFTSPKPEFELAKKWLDDCDKHHECRSYQLRSNQPQKGFRVLDLGTSHDPNICLTTFDDRSRYATLSHCWGTSQPMKLEKKRMDEFKKCITFKELPKTFQDAIEATRCLGIRYLWIDSLCIIQDSKKDWEDQCGVMSDIYSKSYVTLAGTDAENCDSGFLHERRPLMEANLLLTCEGKPCTVNLQYWSPKQTGVRCHPNPKWPLMCRAWVLQERLLSRRVLYFERQTMIMECFLIVRYEDHHYPTSWKYLCGIVPKKRFDDLGSCTKDYWYHMINTYSRLSLSNISDKLPALSGLAAHVAQVSGFRYLAGIWQQHLPEALAWRTVEPIRPRYSESLYIAPSWSWAAAGEASASYDFKHPFERTPNMLEILYGDVNPVEPSAPFGAVDGGCLHVRGKVCQALISGKVGQGIFFRIPGAGYHCGFIDLDVAATLNKHPILLYLGQAERGFSEYYALAIEPVAGSINTYRRIGLAKGSSRNSRFHQCFHNQESEEIILV